MSQCRGHGLVFGLWMWFVPVVFDQYWNSATHGNRYNSDQRNKFVLTFFFNAHIQVIMLSQCSDLRSESFLHQFRKTELGQTLNESLLNQCRLLCISLTKKGDSSFSVNTISPCVCASLPQSPNSSFCQCCQPGDSSFYMVIAQRKQYSVPSKTWSLTNCETTHHTSVNHRRSPLFT